MPNSYSPSINIKRDIDGNHLYVPTKNSIDAYETISRNFKTGVHSYNLIGSYGTGKSAFLLAFYKHLTKEENYFKAVNGQFNGCKEFKFINIVGNYESLTKSLADELNVDNDEDVVYNKIKTLHTKLRKANRCLVIVVDEFGKTLEYSAKHNPEKELYFIQRIAEYANDKNRNILFLTTLHQNFDAYSIGLEEKDRKEWEKVKGRIKELPFNEPVEQLLDLASNAIVNEFPNLKNKKISKSLIKVIRDTNLFKLRNDLSDNLIKKLFPLDPLAASSLLFSLQRYGQNERSLFSYIISLEPFGLKSFLSSIQNTFYSISDVYNYLVYNFSYLLQSRNNPDFFKWRVIGSALDRADNLLINSVPESKLLIKTIGLLDLVHSQNATISKSFILKYGKEVLGITNISSILKVLEEKKILKFQKFRNSYGIFEGTDIDIEQLIATKKKDSGRLASINEDLLKYFKVDYEIAKAISYTIGTPRIFQYKLTTYPVNNFDENQSEIDGFINIVFNKKIKASSLKTKRDEPILFCLINEIDRVISTISEIHLIDKILLEEDLDKVAKQEIIAHKTVLEIDLKADLEQLVYSKTAKWYANGKKVRIASRKDLNKFLSSLAAEIYPNTPKLRSEHINRSKLSGSIHGSKKNYIKALIADWDKLQLNFEDDKFPAERSIYHSLLEESGIHKNGVHVAEFQTPTDKSYKKLWDASLRFIEKTKKGKRPVSEFVDLLRRRPFKLKDGFAEFWVITFLFIHRDEYALYKDGAYVPNFTYEIGELIYKKAEVFDIKAIEVDGIRLKLFNKYRSLIQKDRKTEIKNKGFQEVAKPFLTFYKQLSTYTKTTKKNLSDKTVNFRETLLNAKELEKTFFEDIPNCFGFDLKSLEKDSKILKSFSDSVQRSIKELRLNDDKLILRIKQNIAHYIGINDEDFKLIKSKLTDRYHHRFDHLLSTQQRTLVKRIESPLDEERSWISSISQALIGKQTKNFNDQDEILLYNAINKEFKELDALVSLSGENIDPKTEIAIKYEIFGTDQIKKDNQIVLNKKQLKEVSKLKKELSTFLKNHDQSVVEGTLLEILKSI